MDEWRPVMAMLVFNLISAVMAGLVKMALQQGMDILVLVTLRQLVATAFLSPIAYYKESTTVNPCSACKKTISNKLSF
jgi:uncharacterized membrane protein